MADPTHDRAPADVAGVPLPAQLVWRGLDLRWTYNHRLNRAGSYVWPADAASARVVATAASGSGGDTASVETCATWLAPKDVRITTGAATLRLAGKEGTLLRDARTVRVPCGWDVDVPSAAVLGGFDLYVRGPDGEKADSDKLQRLLLEVADLRRDGHDFELTVRAGLLGRCRSLECVPFEGEVSYEVQVWFTVLSGPGITDQRLVGLTRTYGWDLETPVVLEREYADASLSAASTDAFAGLERFECILDREHHVLELAALLDPPVPIGGGRWRFGWNMGVVNWRPGMWEQQLLSFKAAGHVSLGARARVVGFRSGESAREQVEGRITWPGRNTPPTRPEAIATWTVKREGT